MDNNAIQKDVVAEQDTPGSNKLLSRYVTSHPGQLSLVIPLWVGAMSTSQRAVMPCGWGVRFVCGWQVKLCDPLVTHGPYLSALEIRNLYINSPSYTLL